MGKDAFNEFFFRELGKAVNPTPPTPEEYKATCKELAELLWVQFMAFMERGFTADQAFEFTKLMFAKMS